MRIGPIKRSQRWADLMLSAPYDEDGDEDETTNEQTIENNNLLAISTV